MRKALAAPPGAACRRLQLSRLPRHLCPLLAGTLPRAATPFPSLPPPLRCPWPTSRCAGRGPAGCRNQCRAAPAAGLAPLHGCQRPAAAQRHGQRLAGAPPARHAQQQPLAAPAAPSHPQGLNNNTEAGVVLQPGQRVFLPPFNKDACGEGVCRASAAAPLRPALGRSTPLRCAAAAAASLPCRNTGALGPAHAPACLQAWPCRSPAAAARTKCRAVTLCLTLPAT